MNNFEEQESCSKCQTEKKNPLKLEVESLKQKLIDRNIAFVQLEAKMAEDMPHVYSQGQLATLRATCDSWQDKYERLLEAHKRLQRVNQGLEDKLLRLVDRSESEKAKLSQHTTNLTTALTTAAQAINRLKNENDRYQKDLSLAVQLLQCNPSHYASHKVDMLPSELHHKIKSRLAPEPPKTTKTEAKIIRVPIPTFPPTAMVYSVNKCSEEKEKEEPHDVVSAAILAAILEERERERSKKHCPTCTCPVDTKTNSSFPSNYPNTPSSANHSNTSPDSGYQEKNESKETGNLKRGMFSGSSMCTPFDVNAIDVGTQTLPSYIGETGKVTSTCIYCQSVKTLNDVTVHSVDSRPSSDNSLSNSSNKRKESIGNYTKNSSQSKPDIRSSKLGNCPWDWHTESQDSGSPSTPTSLTSASLSYESEASCFTSPQDSPGHISLHNINGCAQNQCDKRPECNGNNKCVSPKEDLQEQSIEGKRLRAKRCFSFPVSSSLINEYKGKSMEIGYRKKRGSAKLFDKSNENLSKIPANSLQETDLFTPIHISPSERLSSSDSDVISTASNSPKSLKEYQYVLNNKNLLKINRVASENSESHPNNHYGASENLNILPRKTQASDHSDHPSRRNVLSSENSDPSLKLGSKTLKQILCRGNVFLRDTYIGNKENVFMNKKLQKSSENLIIISSTCTGSATETTL